MVAVPGDKVKASHAYGEMAREKGAGQKKNQRSLWNCSQILVRQLSKIIYWKDGN